MAYVRHDAPMRVVIRDVRRVLNSQIVRVDQVELHLDIWSTLQGGGSGRATGTTITVTRCGARAPRSSWPTSHSPSARASCARASRRPRLASGGALRTGRPRQMTAELTCLCVVLVGSIRLVLVSAQVASSTSAVDAPAMMAAAFYP